MRRPARTALAIAALVLALAAGWRLVSGSRSSAGAPGLEVGYWGCGRLFGGDESVCQLGADQALRLRVVAGHAEEVEVVAGERVWRYPSEGEARRTILEDLSDLDGIAEIVVRARRKDAWERWSLALRVLEGPGWRPDTDCGEAEPCEDPAAAIRKRLTRDLPPLERADLLRKLASLGYQENADPRQIVTRLEEALELAISAGDLKTRVDLVTFLSFVHLDRRQDAGAALDTVDRYPDTPPGAADLAFFVAYGKGRTKGRAGRAGEALSLLEGAVEVAARFDREYERIGALQVLIDHLLTLGLFDEAAGHIASIDLDTPPEVFRDPCDHPGFLNNVGWSDLRLSESRGAGGGALPHGVVVALFDRAIEIFERKKCGEQRTANAYLNRALAHLRQGLVEPAGADLDRARTLLGSDGIPTWQRSWLLEVAGRIAHTGKRFDEALAAYAELLELSGLNLEERWRAHLGRARVLAAMESHEEAFEAFGRAEAVLDEEAGQVLIDSGRLGAVDAREVATREYLDLLLARGREARALEVARRARVRALRYFELQQRSARLADDPVWRRLKEAYNASADELRRRLAEYRAATAIEKMRQSPGVEASFDTLASRRAELLGHLAASSSIPDALPSLPEGEVALLFHPVVDGWAGFAWTESERPLVQTLGVWPDSGTAGPEELARFFLEPFSALLRSARRVRVLPYGDSRAVDFHALPYEGRPLAAHAPVLYGLDLSPVPVPELRTALVVRDPTETLLHADEEVRRVERLLTAAGLSVSTPFQEGAGDLVAALSATDLFHFAGHTDVDDANAWDWGLRLAGGAAGDLLRFRIGDLLSLSSVPGVAILSACDGAAQGPGRAEGLGIAQAFLVAGSYRVLAAVRPVDDRVSAELMGAFYQALPVASSAEEALARAQLALQHRPGDWASFRVLTR